MALFGRANLGRFTLAGGVFARSQIWLPDSYGRKNCNCLGLPVAARRCQGLTRPAHIEHEVPVALIRRAKGRCSLVRRGEVGNARPVALRPWEGRSVIAVAQECAQLLKSGGEAEVAEQMRMSRCKMRSLLVLLALPKAIKEHLTRTRDLEGKVGERQLRALLRMKDERAMLVASLKMVQGVGRT